MSLLEFLVERFPPKPLLLNYISGHFGTDDYLLHHYLTNSDLNVRFTRDRKEVSDCRHGSLLSCCVEGVQETLLFL